MSRGLPVIELTPRLAVSLVERVPERLRAMVHGVARGSWIGTMYFTEQGQRFDIARLVPPRPIGLTERLLAATIHNPAITAAIEYVPARAYTLTELREALIRAVEADDDILTQWQEEAELTARLNSATSFADCVSVLRDAGVPVQQVPDS